MSGKTELVTETSPFALPSTSCGSGDELCCAHSKISLRSPVAWKCKLFSRQQFGCMGHKMFERFKRWSLRWPPLQKLLSLCSQNSSSRTRGAPPISNMITSSVVKFVITSSIATLSVLTTPKKLPCWSGWRAMNAWAPEDLARTCKETRGDPSTSENNTIGWPWTRYPTNASPWCSRCVMYSKNSPSRRKGSNVGSLLVSSNRSPTSGVSVAERSPPALLAAA
mmetsp:Transcript_96755/g.273369  ORF Transcript_96755/g.273369 Transcript_96755/m.273369 type:complete len:223 (+) Transcript_96755:1010-1678(+)